MRVSFHTSHRVWQCPSAGARVLNGGCNVQLQRAVQSASVYCTPVPRHGDVDFCNPCLRSCPSRSAPGAKQAMVLSACPVLRKVCHPHLSVSNNRHCSLTFFCIAYACAQDYGVLCLPCVHVHLHRPQGHPALQARHNCRQGGEFSSWGGEGEGGGGV